MPEVAHTTLVRWYTRLRERCGSVMASIEMSGEMDTDIGDLEDIVEIDESVFGKKQKYGKGKATKKTWVFGIAQRSTKHTIFKVVKDRMNETLLPIIQEHIKVDSTIFHDDWAGYRNLQDLGYHHGSVCHKREFVSKSGVCTNLIEG